MFVRQFIDPESCYSDYPLSPGLVSMILAIFFVLACLEQVWMCQEHVWMCPEHSGCVKNTSGSL